MLKATVKSGPAWLALKLLPAFLLLSGCAGTEPVQSNPQTLNPQPAPPASSEVVSADNTTNIVDSAEGAQFEAGAPVSIALIHYQGTLQPLGCCNPRLYEMDEFVVIQNFSHEAQDIRGWKLVNVTKGYPVFTFPDYFPCIPLILNEDPAETSFSNFPERVVSPPRSVEYRLMTIEEAEAARRNREVISPTDIDWSACPPLETLDETPMKPLPGQQGQPVPCVLYPGQSVLVFTNEIRCQYGGFSFNYGNGNIWDNRQPDVAVLYNADGEEVSRRSYQVR